MEIEKSTHFLALLKQQRFIGHLFSITCLTHSTKGSECLGVLGFDERWDQCRALPYQSSNLNHLPNYDDTSPFTSRDFGRHICQNFQRKL